MTPEEIAARNQSDKEKYKDVPPVARVLVRMLCDEGFSYAFEEPYTPRVHWTSPPAVDPNAVSIRVSKHRPKLVDASVIQIRDGVVSCYCTRNIRPKTAITLSDPEAFKKVMEWVCTPTRPAVRQEPPKKKPKMPPPRSWYYPSRGL